MSGGYTEIGGTILKILFLSAVKSVHTMRWVNALAEKGHEVVLVSLKNHCDVRNVISKKVKVVYLPVSGTKGYYLNAYALRKLYKSENFDVVNVHYASGYGTLARLARLPGIILNVWGSDVYDFPYESKLKRTIIRKNLSYADVLASTSHAMAGQIRKFLKEEKKIEITPFGVDLDLFQVKKNSKYKNSELIIGNVKTLEPLYGISYLILAVKILIDSLQKKQLDSTAARIRCFIYGDGSQKRELEEMVQNLKLEDIVKLKGTIAHSQVPDALEEMDIFCATSIQESFGVSVIEAQAKGLPVVVSDAAGFSEVVENGLTGIIVKKESPVETAKALEMLVLDEEMRIQMGRAGRERVERLYDWKNNVSTMEEIYLKRAGMDN